MKRFFYARLEPHTNKKGSPLGPKTFVNLKSNTMKNTLQRYDYYRSLASISPKNYDSITFFNHSNPFLGRFMVKNQRFVRRMPSRYRWAKVYLPPHAARCRDRNESDRYERPLPVSQRLSHRPPADGRDGVCRSAVH